MRSGYRTGGRLELCIGLAVVLAGCASSPNSGRPVTGAPTLDWRTVATPADLDRIRNWRTAFTTALAAARAGGHSEQIEREGPLLLPDAALDDPRPPAGDYRCRIIKMGAKGSGMADFTAYPGFECRIDDEGDVSSFRKVGGSQRPVGILLNDSVRRQIFLGTLMLGEERRALDYGTDPDRDMAGAVERIGERRWRMILPYPRFESIMDVVELVPAK